MSKRAAIYARVSTKDQKDHGYSLGTQVDACRAYAAEHGYSIVGEYQEDYTGLSMDRPQLDALREAVPREGMKVILVLELDRLARKAVYQMLLEEEFAKLGAAIEYVNERYDDSDEGRLQKHIKSAVAEYERAKILSRMTRGKIGKVKSGQVLISNNPPYGYRKNGQRKDGYQGPAMLVVDEAEAAIVRQVYTWYTGRERDGRYTLDLRTQSRGI